MAQALQIGNVTVQPGEVKRGGIPLGTDMYGIERAMPIIVYRGVEDGPRLWINGATHGDEPEGPYSIHLLLKQIDVTKLKGMIVAVPAMNIEAFTGGDRGDPRDTFSYDMNRIYPGKADGYSTERVAWAHWAVMKEHCDLQIAIHSGGDHSFLDTAIFASDVPASLELAAAMGPDWDLVNASSAGRGSPSSMMAELGRGGITVELGGWCSMFKTDFHEVGRRLSDAYLNVLRHYGMIEGQPQYADKWLRGHQVALLANSTGLFIGEDVQLRTAMKGGTVLGHIYNLYGDEIETLSAPADGQIFGLRFRVMTQTGDWCCFYAVIDAVRDDFLTRK